MQRLIKPRYIDPLGNREFSALSVSPPFRFRNATARVFPIRANMSVLKNFCDLYLNMDIPDDIVCYSPALPYVYMMILNYGSMAAASVKAQNVGWVSQHEVTFTVPLQKWRRENGKLVFKDWASVSPFIYVDDEFSLQNGREVYGWNKVSAQIDTSVPLWAGDPRARIRLFDLSVDDFEDAYQGDQISRRPLLHIDAEPPPSFLQFPPDPRNQWSPLWTLPNAVAGASNLIGSVVDTALSLNVRGFEPHRSIDSFIAMARNAGGKVKAILPALPPLHGNEATSQTFDTSDGGMSKLFVDVVTMKQFRNPENPDLACYQALVTSPMGIDRVNRCGLLGDLNLLRGDVSGGFNVRIHKYDAQPIVECLGLQVESWSDPDSDNGVATLKPVLPYWLDVDLLYGKGRNICSRTPWDHRKPEMGWPWIAEADPEAEAGKKAAGKTAKTKLTATKQTTPEPAPSPTYDPQLPLYNTTLGAATQAIAGPFNFPDVTMQVYPLLADADKIREIVTEHLNKQLNQGPQGATGWHFEPFGSYVYMIVTVYGDRMGDQWSTANNIGGFFSREVTFCVPVKWYDKDGKLVSVAMIEPLTYSNSGRGVTTDREINGYNSIKSTIVSPEDMWLAPNGPAAHRQYLNLATEVIPALNVGQKAEQQTLIEIDERPVLPESAAAQWRGIADNWGREVIDELKRKAILDEGGAAAEIALYENPADSKIDEKLLRNLVGTSKALALELLANGEPFNRLVYKQYRDSNDYDRACYQALVKATSTITSIYDLREIESDVHVRFHCQPGHPIVSGFGIKVKHTESRDGCVVEIVQPQRPFWTRVALREDLAEVVCFRSDEEHGWQVVHPWFQKSADASPTPDKTDPLAAFADPEPNASTPPYFRRRGGSRVGSWLGNVRKASPLLTGDGSLRSLASDPAVQAALIAEFDSTSDGASLHNNLKSEASHWLRKALINELSWIRATITTDKIGSAIFNDTRIRGTRTGRAVFDIMNCPLDISSIRVATQSYSIDELMRICSAIDAATGQRVAPPKDGAAFKAAPQMKPNDEERFQSIRRAAESQLLKSKNGASTKISDEISKKILVNRFILDFFHTVFELDQFFGKSSDTISAAGAVWAWQSIVDTNRTIEFFKNFIYNFRKATRGHKLALMLSLRIDAVDLMLGIKKYVDDGELEKLALSQSSGRWEATGLEKFKLIINQMDLLKEILEPIYLDWHYPYRWRRFVCDANFPADAGKAHVHNACQLIDRLDDVQMVIDNILSSEWENHGKTRWNNPKPSRKPDQYVKAGPDVNLTAIQQGLLQWKDPVTNEASDLWIAAKQNTSYQLAPQPLHQLNPPKLRSSRQGGGTPKPISKTYTQKA